MEDEKYVNDLDHARARAPPTSSGFSRHGCVFLPTFHLPAARTRPRTTATTTMAAYTPRYIPQHSLENLKKYSYKGVDKYATRSPCVRS